MGNQHSRTANRNWFANSLPHDSGGATALTSVLPVRIPIDPTVSTKLVVLRPARATAAVIAPAPPPWDEGARYRCVPGAATENRHRVLFSTMTPEHLDVLI